MLTITAYDRHVEQLFEIVQRLCAGLSRAGIEYRLVGGLAVFLYVDEIDPLASRSTRDIDIAVDRRDLKAIESAVRPLGFRYRHSAGVDMLLDAANPRARSPVHMVFVREKVRPEYLEPVPDFSPPSVTAEGVKLAPLADLVKMKLTSFRDQDRVHVRDLDAVGLITSEIEEGLPASLHARLQEIRATE